MVLCFAKGVTDEDLIDSVCKLTSSLYPRFVPAYVGNVDIHYQEAIFLLYLVLKFLTIILR